MFFDMTGVTYCELIHKDRFSIQKGLNSDFRVKPFLHLFNYHLQQSHDYALSVLSRTISHLHMYGPFRCLYDL